MRLRPLRSGVRRRFRRRSLEERGTMTLLEHLEELRERLLWIAAAVAVAGVAGWALFDRVVDLLLHPARPYLRDLSGGKLVFTGPVEALGLRVKVALYVGFALAFPIVLWHVWRFVSPGLHRHERRLALPFIVSGFVFFAGGVVFAYVTMPGALRYLIGPAITGKDVRPLLGAKSYVDFALLYLVSFGIGFEFPVGIMFASRLGVVRSEQLARWRRHAFFAIAVVVAVLTPTFDWFSMTALTVVLYLLYEACIWLARLLGR